MLIVVMELNRSDSVKNVAQEGFPNGPEDEDTDTEDI